MTDDFQRLFAGERCTHRLLDILGVTYFQYIQANSLAFTTNYTGTASLSQRSAPRICSKDVDAGYKAGCEELARSNSSPEHFLECHDSVFGNLDRSSHAPSSDPVPLEAEISDSGPDPAGEMRAPLAPVEARPAKRPTAASGRTEVDANIDQEARSFRSQFPGIGVKNEIPTFDHRVGKRDAKLPG
jgi:hypothetical protein